MQVAVRELSQTIVMVTHDPKAAYGDRRVTLRDGRVEEGNRQRATGNGGGPELPEPLRAGVPVYLLAWTTTPWTLPGNTALAVDEDAEYVVVELDPRPAGTPSHRSAQPPPL